MKIAIFGGSFDPVHFGHLGIIQGLVNGGYDRIIVVPTFVSPFKSNDRIAVSAEHRDEMLRQAFMEFLFQSADNSLAANAVANFIRNGGLVISDIEIKRKGISYTYDTIKELKKEYLDDSQMSLATFDFVIGWDCIARLENWGNFDELKKIVGFLAVKRGSDGAYESKIEELKNKGVDIRTAGFEVPNISSSYVRILNAFGRILEAVPKSVAEYIKENRLYREYRYIAKRHVESGLSKERTEHCLRVAEEAINLAKVNGVNVNDAITAALLHDIAKNVEWSEMANSQYLSLEDTEFIDKLPEPCRHAWIGAWAVEKLMEFSPEIAEAVRLHTTGAPNMTTLAKIIYLADYIEKGREVKNLREIRKVAYNDLDEGIRVVLGQVLRHLEQKSEEICHLTREAYKYYNENKA